MTQLPLELIAASEYIQVSIDAVNKVLVFQ